MPLRPDEIDEVKAIVDSKFANIEANIKKLLDLCKQTDAIIAESKKEIVLDKPVLEVKVEDDFLPDEIEPVKSTRNKTKT